MTNTVYAKRCYRERIYRLHIDTVTPEFIPLPCCLSAVYRARWLHQFRVLSMCFACWWDISPIWAEKPLLTQKTIGAEASGKPWPRLWSCWYFGDIFSSIWLFPLWMACFHRCRSCARASQVSIAMCVAFRCRLTISLYCCRSPSWRCYPLANSP